MKEKLCGTKYLKETMGKKLGSGALKNEKVNGVGFFYFILISK